MTKHRPLRLLLLCLVVSLSLAGLALAQTDPTTTTSVRFLGVIDAMDTNTITVNGQVIDVSSAQINTALQVGAEVVVEGTLDAGNVIRASAVNALSSLRPGETEIVGVLSSATGGSLTVGGATIDITSATVDAGLSVGNVVRIAATRGDDGRWIARDVERVVSGATSRDPNAPLASDDDFEIRGTLTSTADNAIVVSGLTIDATSAQIEGQLVLGAQVRARVTLANGQLVAREIRLSSDDDDDDAACVTAAPAGWTTYTIRSGDTLSGVAARSGSSLAELARVNCISDVRLLITGTTLFVPRPLVADNRGSDRGNSNDNRGSFNDNRGSFNDNQGGFNDNRGSFNDNRGGFNDNRDSFDSNRGSTSANDSDRPSNRRSIDSNRGSTSANDSDRDSR